MVGFIILFTNLTEAIRSQNGTEHVELLVQVENCRCARSYRTQVKLLSIADSKLLFSPKTSLFFYNRAEIDNMLNQQCWIIWLQPGEITRRVSLRLWLCLWYDPENSIFSNIYFSIRLEIVPYAEILINLYCKMRWSTKTIDVTC